MPSWRWNHSIRALERSREMSYGLSSVGRLPWVGVRKNAEWVISTPEDNLTPPDLFSWVRHLGCEGREEKWRWCHPCYVGYLKDCWEWRVSAQESGGRGGCLFNNQISLETSEGQHWWNMGTRYQDRRNGVRSMSIQISNAGIFLKGLRGVLESIVVFLDFCLFSTVQITSMYLCESFSACKSCRESGRLRSLEAMLQRRRKALWISWRKGLLRSVHPWQTRG